MLLRLTMFYAMLLLSTGDMRPTSDNGYANDAIANNQKVLVKRGDQAVLPCGLDVIQIDDIMTWFKEDKIVAIYRAGSDEVSPTPFIIEEVGDSDAGTYRCRVTPVNGPIVDHILEVDLLASPVNVSIRTDNNDNFEAGSPRVLACIVYGLVPSPNVTWYLGDTMLRPNVYKEVNRGNFTVSSLTFVPSLTDNGKELVCMVTDKYMTETFEDRVVISVGHRPMCIDSGFKSIGAIEGDTETLVCMVESYPEPEQFIWTFADGRTIYTSSKKVSEHENWYSSTLVWVPREDDFGPLYCRASNRFGEQKQPCTFSVIRGGPPPTPECKIFWENKESLRVRCKKNWDGGRPQTIHLEVKGQDGTRKVSRRGHELIVDSLQRGVNFTAELYASNSRGRSLVVQLGLPEPPAANVPPEHSYTSTQSPWTIIMSNIMFIIVAAIIGLGGLWMCKSQLYRCCRTVFCVGYQGGSSEGSMERHDDIAMEAIQPNTDIAFNNNDNEQAPPTPPERPARQLLASHRPPTQAPRTRKINFAVDHYFL